MVTRISTLATSPHAASDREGSLVRIVRASLDGAITGVVGPDQEVLTMKGMSGTRYRRLINTLVAQMTSPRYLEVGSWAGSTLCSAIAGNAVDAVAVDNWSQFESPSAAFFGHLAKFKGSARVSFIEQDFRLLDFGRLASIYGAFNIYLYDGPHSAKDQYDGLVMAQPSLASSYVQIVDDWNWQAVRDGTCRAISDLGLHVEFMAEIRTTFDDSHAPLPAGEASDWHNGYCISVLSRPN